MKQLLIISAVALLSSPVHAYRVNGTHDGTGTAPVGLIVGLTVGLFVFFALIIGWCVWIRRRKARKLALAKEAGIELQHTPDEALPWWKRLVGVAQAPGYVKEAPRTYNGPPQAMKGYLPSRPW